MSDNKITRIDLWEQPTGVIIKKWADGWYASTPPVERTVNHQMTLDEMVDWLNLHGWKVRTWDGGVNGRRGARAWLGKVLPVRSRYQIFLTREMYTRERNLLPDNVNLWQCDFALDY